MKFSIIIPVYNTEKYLERCLNSVIDGTYQNFEIIIVNDGSTDNSLNIIKKYLSDKVKVINQKNGGLSHARNEGVKLATGDYILYLDSDDFYDKYLLEKLNEAITNEDMIKFGYKEYKEENIQEIKSVEFDNLKGNEALKKLIDSKTMFEMAWLYCIKTDYMVKYKFTEGKYHEDFGLIPIMINEAENIKAINYNGYIYNKENNSSITSYTNNEKEYKKAKDTMYFFKSVKSKYKDKVLLSFYANAVLNKTKKLTNEALKEYKREIKKEKVYDYILSDTLKRKIKKIIIKTKYLF